MDSNLAQELLQLSIAERIQLAEDLWDSVLQSSNEILLSDEQKQELDRRLARFDSQTSSSSWGDVKSRILSK